MAQNAHPLLSEVLAFCKAHDLSDTRFGGLIMGRPNFIKTLREDPDTITTKSVKKCRDRMAAHTKKQIQKLKGI